MRSRWYGPVRVALGDGELSIERFGSRRVTWLVIRWGAATVDRDAA